MSEYTLNADLWKIYVNYTDEKCKKGSDKQEIYQRAIKNCPFELDFWLGYMREQEKNSVALEVIVQTALQLVKLESKNKVSNSSMIY